ncbi:MAG: hypothetical protein J5848_03570 [Bacteroidales bacterium]|nr:hypothetical protein [Bacteroidales bacterium]
MQKKSAFLGSPKERGSGRRKSSSRDSVTRELAGLSYLFYFFRKDITTTLFTSLRRSPCSDTSRLVHRPARDFLSPSD